MHIYCYCKSLLLEISKKSGFSYFNILLKRTLFLADIFDSTRSYFMFIKN